MKSFAYGSSLLVYNISVDPINPIAGNPEAINQNPSTKTPSDNHWVSILAMAIFVLFFLAVVAFLYYQNQQLKNMLASYQTPVASPTPSAAADPTANWKTYTNTTYKYAAKIPNDWEAVKQVGNDTVISVRPVGASNIPVIFNAQVNKSGLSLNTWVDNQLGKSYPRESKKLNGYDTIFVHNTTSPYESDAYYLTNNSIIYELSGSTLNQEQKAIFDQILSTFKFTSPTSSPSAKPVACTQEAKICPDGSSVGRTGPNCEFTACPTP